MKQIRRLFGRNRKTLFDGVGWILNEDMNSCMICTMEFSFFNGRHHCRACGNIICGTCSPQFIIIHELSQFGKQRVCNQCYWGQEMVYMSNNRIPKDLNVDFIDEDLVTAATYLRLNNQNPIKTLLRSTANASYLSNSNANTDYNTVEENTWFIFGGSDSMNNISEKVNEKDSPNIETLIPKHTENNITSSIGSQIHSPPTSILNQNRSRLSSSRLLSTYVLLPKGIESNIDDQLVVDTKSNALPETLNEMGPNSCVIRVGAVDTGSLSRETNSSSSSTVASNSITTNVADGKMSTSNVSSKIWALNNKTVAKGGVMTESTVTSVICDVIPNEDNINISESVETDSHSNLFHFRVPSHLISGDTDNIHVEKKCSNLTNLDSSDYNRGQDNMLSISYIQTNDEAKYTSTINNTPFSDNKSVTKPANIALIIPNPLFVIKTYLCAVDPSHKNEYIGTKVFLNILTTGNVRKINKVKNQVFFFVVPQLKETSDNTGSKAFVIDIIINADHALQKDDKVVKDAICSQVIEIVLVHAKSNMVYSDDLISISDEDYCKLDMKYSLPLITNNYKSSLNTNNPSEILIPIDLQNEEDKIVENKTNEVTINDDAINEEVITSVNYSFHQKKELDSDDDDNDDLTQNNDLGKSNSQNDNAAANYTTPLRLSNSSISATAVRASSTTEIQKWNVFIKPTAIILALGLIGKKNPIGIMYKRKLILSSEPSLIYVDPVSMQVKGKIKWDKIIIPRASIFTSNCFEILSDKRTYRFYCDSNNHAAEWVMEINNAAKSLIPNFLDNDPESIYFSP